MYQYYVWNGEKSKEARQSNKCKIIDIQKLGDIGLLFKIEVSKTLARQLREPGSYVFLRNDGSEQYFDAPMSICDSDEVNGIITIATQIVGAKTKMLAQAKDYLLVRGPYWGGIYGLTDIKKTKDSSCLLICRGIAQGPALLLGKKLARYNNRLIYIIDKGRTNTNFILEEVRSLGAEYVEMNLLDKSSNPRILDIINKYSPQLIFSSGSDKQHLSLLKLLEDNSIKSAFTITNNTEICCGEGICGSCTTQIEPGVFVKACKTQIDVKKAIERRV